MKSWLIPVSTGCALLATALAVLAQDSDLTYPQGRSTPRVSPTAGRQTAIQRQLQQMYQKDGREMPNMDLSQMPSNSRQVGVPRGQSPQGYGAPPDPYGRAPAQPAQVAAGGPTKRSFLQRITPRFMRRNKDDEEKTAKKDSEPKPPADQRPLDNEDEDEEPEATPPQYRQNARQPYAQQPRAPQPYAQQPSSRQQPYGPQPRVRQETVQQPPARIAPPQALPLDTPPEPEPQVARRPAAPKAAPRPEPLLDESNVSDDAEEMTDLNDSLTETETPQQPKGLPPLEVEGNDAPTESPFTGITINPGERETEMADEAPQLPEDPQANSAPSVESPKAPAPTPSVKAIPSPELKSEEPKAAATPSLSAVKEPTAAIEKPAEERKAPAVSTPAELPTLDEELGAASPSPKATAPKTATKPAPAAPSAAPAAPEKKVLPETPAASPEKPAAPAASATPAETPSAKAAETPALPIEKEVPVLKMPEHELPGIKGYCLVTLKQERKLVAGSDKFRSIYQGHVYKFATAAAKARFEANPAEFAPLHEGHDVVALGQGEKVEGSLDHAVWFRGKLYMFSSEKTLNTFVGSPAKYVAR